MTLFKQSSPLDLRVYTHHKSWVKLVFCSVREPFKGSINARTASASQLSECVRHKPGVVVCNGPMFLSCCWSAKPVHVAHPSYLGKCPKSAQAPLSELFLTPDGAILLRDSQHQSQAVSAGYHTSVWGANPSSVAPPIMMAAYLESTARWQL
jgi:hypothetical protein